MFTFNPLYLLLLVPMLFAWWSQNRVRKTYEEYSARPNHHGYRGVEVTRCLLTFYRLTGITYERASGRLADHYDPRDNFLRLSDGIANRDSVTSMGIVAHEVGHAAQDAENYRFMRLRTSLAPRVGQVIQWSSVAFIGRWIFGIPLLMAFSGIIMGAMVLYSLVPLPVERNASDLALKSLEESGLATGEEREGVRQVLQAASFTYLAGLARQFGRFMFFVVMVAAAKGFVNLV